MKLILLTACLPFCALPLGQAADLFAPPPPKPDSHAAYKKYTTSAALFDATRNGEFLELIGNFHGDFNGIIQMVLGIFRNDHRYANITQSQASEGAQLLETLTRYELADEKRKADIEREFGVMHKRLYDFQEEPRFITALDSFLKDYTKAVKGHIGIKNEAEAKKMAAAATTRAAEEAKEQQAIAATNARLASMKAEEEMRATAVRGAIAGQEKIREQKLQEALASSAYKIWQVSLQVEEGLRLVENAKQILSKDDAVRRESGVTDLSMRRTAGERIVAGKTLVEQAFATYKKLGGEARKPEDVKAGADPARDYR